MKIPLAANVSLEHAFDMGRDCALNGANTTNCHFSLFSSPEMTAAWERGKESTRPVDPFAQIRVVKPNARKARKVRR